jgi:hypothetical protein
MKTFLLLAFCLLFALSIVAQAPLLQGKLVPETAALVDNDRVYLCYKEYQGLSKEEEQELRKTGMMGYMDIPIYAQAVVMNGDVFNSYLACIKNGKLTWTKKIGQSNRTPPTALAIDDNGTVYTGEKQADQATVVLYKFDAQGQELWSASFDSLETVHRILVDTGTVLTALVSFTYTQKVEHGSKFRYESNFAFATLTLDKATGKRLSKVENRGLTYFSALGYNHSTLNNSSPILASSYTNYQYRGDTLVYARNDNDKMMFLSIKELDNQDIVDVVGYDNSYFVWSKKRSTGAFQLLVNRWVTDDLLNKVVELDLPPSARPLKATRNANKGVTLYYKRGNAVYVLQANKDLQITTEKTALKIKKGVLLSDLFINKESKVQGIMVEQTGKTRTLRLD